MQEICGAQSAESAAASLKLSMSGTLTGPEATDRFGDGSDGWVNGFQFDCGFKNGVDRFVFDGKSGIKGLDVSGREVFSHKYAFDSYNPDLDFYVYKSEDANQDEFTYFAMRSDSPEATHHIEFRYGTDIQLLNKFCTGKYAYWVAAGVLCGSDSEQQEAISLFVKENLEQQ